MNTQTPILDGAAFRMNQAIPADPDDEVTVSPQAAGVQPLKPQLEEPPLAVIIEVVGGCAHVAYCAPEKVGEA